MDEKCEYWGFLIFFLDRRSLFCFTLFTWNCDQPYPCHCLQISNCKVSRSSNIHWSWISWVILLDRHLLKPFGLWHLGFPETRFPFRQNYQISTSCMSILIYAQASLTLSTKRISALIKRTKEHFFRSKPHSWLVYRLNVHRWMLHFSLSKNFP